VRRYAKCGRVENLTHIAHWTHSQDRWMVSGEQQTLAWVREARAKVRWGAGGFTAPAGGRAAIRPQRELRGP